VHLVDRGAPALRLAERLADPGGILTPPRPELLDA
jgi:hypothetical protein